MSEPSFQSFGGGIPDPEEVKPLPIRRDDSTLWRLKFALRTIVDLQLLTCVRFLRPHLKRMEGSVLDVGCGEMPFRSLLPASAQYTGIDVASAGDFGMRGGDQVIEFDGVNIPFADESFDFILCTEVLEHAAEPMALIEEMRRVLRVGGTLLATVPFSARVHHAPHDFHRFTRYRLAQLFACYKEVMIEERGSDFAVIANKLIVICIRLAKRSRAVVWPLPFLLLWSIPASVSLAIAHASLRLPMGSKADPLGYGIVARKG